MAGMTADQLKEFIKETTLPLLKDAVGRDVADLVRQQVEAAVAPLRQAAPGGWSQRLFGGEEKVPVLEPGTEFARCLRAVAAAKLAGEGPGKAMDILRSWGHADLASKWESARAKALSAGDPTSGGFLIPTQFSSDVIELLRPAAVVRSLNPMTLPMPNGAIKVPKITTGATASYIGENANISKSEEKFGQLTLTWKKLAVLVPISNDLIRYSSPNADAVVRDDVVRAMAQREDQAFIRDDGTSGTPKGLKYWVNAANKFDAQATSLANVTIDLGKALQLVMAAGIPLVNMQNLPGTTSAVSATSRPGWIFSPRSYRYLSTILTTNGTYAFRDEMLRGTLWGWPYRVTSQVQETLRAGTGSEVYFGAFAHAIIGEALGLQVDASQDAAYHDGSSVVAAFSQDQTVIRVIAEHDFALRHDKAFVLIENVLWGT